MATRESKGRERIIDQLRRLTGQQWRYADGEWRSDTGRRIYICAALAPRYDGDDDSFEIQYRDRATGELVGSGKLIYHV